MVDRFALNFNLNDKQACFNFNQHSYILGKRSYLPKMHCFHSTTLQFTRRPVLVSQEFFQLSGSKERSCLHAVIKNLGSIVVHLNLSEFIPL